MIIMTAFTLKIMIIIIIVMMTMIIIIMIISSGRHIIYEEYCEYNGLFYY